VQRAAVGRGLGCIWRRPHVDWVVPVSGQPSSLHAIAATVDATAIAHIPVVPGGIGCVTCLVLRDHSFSAPHERQRDENRGEPCTPVHYNIRDAGRRRSATCPRPLASMFRLQFGLAFVRPDCLARFDRFVHLELPIWMRLSHSTQSHRHWQSRASGRRRGYGLPGGPIRGEQCWCLGPARRICNKRYGGSDPRGQSRNRS